jgi:hypothetical protein
MSIWLVLGRGKMIPLRFLQACPLASDEGVIFITEYADEVFRRVV